MGSKALKLPALLKALLAAGHWPRTREEANRQNLQPLIPAERVRLFAAEENEIHLSAPPFHTVADEDNGGSKRFWQEYGALEQIAPERSLIIGDFGLGSDSPIILDYREGSNPPVLRLRWLELEPGQVRTDWVKGAMSFDEFAEMLGLRVPAAPDE